MKSFCIVQRTDPQGRIVAVPRAVISGARPGPTVAIVAGVHGCEYAGIEASMRLYRDLDPEELAGTVRIAMVADLPAFRARSMYRCPIDQGNVGASFPGSPSGTYSELIAHVIWREVVGDAEYVLDLHGGDLIEDLTQYVGVRLTGNRELDKKATDAALSLGAENLEMRLVPAEEGGLALHVAAAKAGKVGLLVEAGRQGRRDEEDVAFHCHSVTNLMRHAGMLGGPAAPVRPDVRILDEFIAVKAGKEGVFYPSVQPNDAVEKGQPLGEVRDLTGEMLEEVTSPARGVILGTITSASTREGSILFGLGRLKEA